MIPQFDHHAGFVWAVFAVIVVTLSLLVAFVFWRARMARLEADQLELEELDL